MTYAATLADLAKKFHAISRGRYPNHSSWLRRWSAEVSRDDEILELITTLPAAKQQPELLFAAARFTGVRDPEYNTLRHALIGDWDSVEATIRARTVLPTQLLPAAAMQCVLADLAHPVSLIEVHCGAGLLANLAQFSFTHRHHDTEHCVHPVTGASEVQVIGTHQGPVPAVGQRSDVVWARGLDQHPIDVFDGDDVAWLNALVWPDQSDVAQQLTNALHQARLAPLTIVPEPVPTGLPALIAEAPADTKIVVCRQVAHLSAAQRSHLDELVTTAGGLSITFAPDPTHADHWAMSVAGRYTARLHTGTKTIIWAD